MATLWTAPRTWTNNEVVDQGMMNVHVRDNLLFLFNPPTVNLYHSANQSIPNNTLTTLTFDSEQHDTWSMHSGGSPTRITIPTGGDGVYNISAHVSWAAQTASRLLQIILNGSTPIANQEIYLSSSIPLGQSIARVGYKLSAGDYLEVKVLQNSGVALNVERVNDISPGFGATWVARGV